MNVAKSSLVGLLLDNGEDDLAVVLAGCSLPDIIDLDRDRDTLCALGIPVDDVTPSVVSAASLTRHDDGGTVRAELMEATVSRRCADLVDAWIHASRSV